MGQLSWGIPICQDSAASHPRRDTGRGHGCDDGLPAAGAQPTAQTPQAHRGGCEKARQGLRSSAQCPGGAVRAPGAGSRVGSAPLRSDVQALAEARRVGRQADRQPGGCGARQLCWPTSKVCSPGELERQSAGPSVEPLARACHVAPLPHCPSVLSIACTSLMKPSRHLGCGCSSGQRELHARARQPFPRSAQTTTIVGIESRPAQRCRSSVRFRLPGLPTVGVFSSAFRPHPGARRQETLSCLTRERWGCPLRIAHAASQPVRCAQQLRFPFLHPSPQV